MRIAEKTGRECMLYWPVNDQLMCPFDALFANFTVMTEQDLHLLLRTEYTVKVYNAWREQAPLFVDIAADGDPAADIVVIKSWCYPRFAGEAAGTEFSQKIQQQLLKLTPHPEVLAEVDAFPLPPACLGVHVRRGDHPDFFSDSQDEHFVTIMEAVVASDPTVQFFLATDVLAVEEKFKARFGERIVTFPKLGRGREDVRGGREALIDLLLLSRTAAVLGNAASTYSFTASLLGNIPLRLATAKTAGLECEAVCRDFLAALPMPAPAFTSIA
jgi:hypothetical protein